MGCLPRHGARKSVLEGVGSRPWQTCTLKEGPHWGLQSGGALAEGSAFYRAKQGYMEATVHPQAPFNTQSQLPLAKAQCRTPSWL